MEQFAGPPFFPYDLFDWFTRVLPGNVVSASIDAIMIITMGLLLLPWGTVLGRYLQDLETPLPTPCAPGTRPGTAPRRCSPGSGQ